MTETPGTLRGQDITRSDDYLNSVLALVGLKGGKIARFFNASVIEKGRFVRVTTRTGCQGRTQWAQRALFANPFFRRTREHPRDWTYAWFDFEVPKDRRAKARAMMENVHD